jgi:hypothetical protein
MPAYELRPRKDQRGVDLISDVLPFGIPRSLVTPLVVSTKPWMLMRWLVTIPAVKT